MPAKKNPRKQNLGIWLAILIVILVCILPIPVWARVVIIVVLAAGFLYWRRSIIFFLIGNRKLVGNEKKGKKPQPEQAWPWYRKAWAANIPTNYAAIIASTFIQRDDAQFGKEILEAIVAKYPGTDLANTSKVAMSMAYWRLGDLQGAIDILEEVRESGFSDKNLYINLGTYLLEKGEYKRAKKIIDESKKVGPESPGVTDNKGWYYIATGEWNNAKKLYEELTEDRKPKFPEAYVHAAQVQVHFGNYEGAIDLLERALSQKFVLTAGVSVDIIEDMLEGLRNPATRKRTAASIEASARIVAAGGAPLAVDDSAIAADPETPHKNFQHGSAKKASTKSSAQAAAPVALELVEASEAEETDDGLSIDEDDGPTDEDFGLVCDDYYSDSDEDADVDTSVDDDDDREPNTELDENDFLDDEVDDDDSDEDDVPDYDLDDDDDREPNIELDDEDLYDDSDESDEPSEVAGKKK